MDRSALAHAGVCMCVGVQGGGVPLRMVRMHREGKKTYILGTLALVRLMWWPDRATVALRRFARRETLSETQVNCVPRHATTIML